MPLTAIALCNCVTDGWSATPRTPQLPSPRRSAHRVCCLFQMVGTRNGFTRSPLDMCVRNSGYEFVGADGCADRNHSNAGSLATRHFASVRDAEVTQPDPRLRARAGPGAGFGQLAASRPAYA